MQHRVRGSGQGEVVRWCSGRVLQAGGDLLQMPTQRCNCTHWVQLYQTSCAAMPVLPSMPN
jgi:hypothetical protein